MANENTTTPICYHGGKVPVLLGDVVSVRVLFKRYQGRVVYVPGISPRHVEMESDGLVDVGIRVPGKAMVGVTVLPDTRTIKQSIQFIQRDPDGAFQQVRPDENLFEDKEGNPL